MTALHQIRSQAIGKANRLQRAARHLEALRPAFDQWAAGEIYVCKRTGTYRFRFGADSKSVAPWDAIAREVFPTQHFWEEGASLANRATLDDPYEQRAREIRSDQQLDLDL